MKKIAFNENDLIDSLGEALSHAQGKLTLKTTKVPSKAQPISPAAIDARGDGDAAELVYPWFT